MVYPQAMTLLPAPPLWSTLFFFMIITLGLDSQFAAVETVVTGVADFYPKLRYYKVQILGISCCLYFLAALTMTTPGGPYMLQIMDDYSCYYNVMLIAILECVSIAWIYGENSIVIFPIVEYSN